MKAHPILSQLRPDPLDPEQILTGEALTSDLTLTVSDDGSETSGLWRCTPGTFADVEARESFMVISGHATLRYEDGTEHDLRPGTVHTFEGGERTVWTVHETILKAYWIVE